MPKKIQEHKIDIYFDETLEKDEDGKEYKKLRVRCPVVEDACSEDHIFQMLCQKKIALKKERAGEIYKQL